MLRYCLATYLLCVALWRVIPADATTPTSHIRRAPPSTQHQRAAIPFRKITSVHIYLVALGDKGRSGKRIGCGDSLVAVSRPIPQTTRPLAAALHLLLSDHHEYYGQSGLYNSLYRSRPNVERASVVNGKATISLVGRLRLGGVCDDPRVKGQLRQTALQFRSVHSVAIFVNHVSLTKVLSGKGR